MTVVEHERSLAALLGLNVDLEVSPPSDKPRLVVMTHGYQMLVRQPQTPFAIEDWNDRSVECIGNLMPEGSAFITYVYVPYEKLEAYVFARECHQSWLKAGVGSINIYGDHGVDGSRHTTVKLSDRPNTVHLLSQDYLCSFGPKPKRETAFNGALRFHKMWTTALQDIGLLALLDGELSTNEPRSKLIDQYTLPKLAAKGFSSPFYCQLATVRDIHPGEPYLRDPEVRIFTNQ